MKFGVIKVKQCQSNRDGKGPSRICPRALVASQPAVRRLLDDGGETTPPTPFLVTYLMGRADGPGIPGCWTLRSGSSSHLGLLAHRAGAVCGLGHSTVRSRPWAKQSLGPSSARADRMLTPLLLKQDQQQELLPSAHSGLWQESSLVMPRVLSLHQDCLDQPKAGGKEKQPRVRLQHQARSGS